MPLDNNTPEPACLAAALEYANLGYSVVPLHGVRDGGNCTCERQNCGSPGKHPIGSWKERQRNNLSQGDIENFFRNHPEANVGIVTGRISGIVVLDIDGDEGEAALARMGLSLEGVAIVQTGRGRHLYFKYPDGENLTNFSRGLPSIDGRANGGYVVAPPSIHASGARYAWADQSQSSLKALPPLLDELLPLFRKEKPKEICPELDVSANGAIDDQDHGKSVRETCNGSLSPRDIAYGKAALEKECASLRAAPEGKRNDTLNRAAFSLGQLVGGNLLDRQSVEQELRSAAMAIGLSGEEGELTIRSGIESGLSTPRVLPEPDKGGSKSGHQQPDEWPKPADILENDVEAAVPFPIEFLPEPFRSFVSDAAERMQLSPDFVAIPCLIAAATALGTKFRLSPKQHDPWSERCCLWGGIIAGPGTGKTQAFNAALLPLHNLQKEFYETFRKELAEYVASMDLFKVTEEVTEKEWKKQVKDAVKRGETPPKKPEFTEKLERPKLTRLYTHEPTQEAIVDLIATNPNGILLFRDELSGWFSSFNQYRPGADRQFYLEAHAGGQYVKDRKHQPSVVIPELYLNICGGFQPEVVAEALKNGDRDGMAARFSLLAYPDIGKSYKYIDRQADLKAQRAVEKAFQKLFDLKEEDVFGSMYLEPNKVLRLDETAQGIFEKWYTALQILLRSKQLDPAMQAHLSKYPGLFARLCLLIHLLRFVVGEKVNPREVDAETAKHVIKFIDEYLASHARRIYRLLGQDPAYQGARSIARYLNGNRDVTQFKARDIRRKKWSGLTTHESVNQALDYLENVAGWVRCEEVLSGPKGGRPSTVYHVNPQIRSME